MVMNTITHIIGWNIAGMLVGVGLDNQNGVKRIRGKPFSITTDWGEMLVAGRTTRQGEMWGIFQLP